MQTKRKKREPLMGTWNQRTPTAVTRIICPKPVAADGDHLCEHQLQGPDGGHHELLDGADLPLPHDRHGRHHEAGKQRDQRDDAGQKKVAAPQVRVVPDPCAEIGRPRIGRRRHGQILRKPPDDHGDMIHGDQGGIGVRAVDEHLQGGRGGMPSLYPSRTPC